MLDSMLGSVNVVWGYVEFSFAGACFAPCLPSDAVQVFGEKEVAPSLFLKKSTSVGKRNNESASAYVHDPSHAGV